MDGSQKLPPRILTPAIEAIAAGGDADAFAYVTALWLAYLLRTDEVSDPRATELRAAAVACVPGRWRSAPFFAVAGLFPSQLITDRRWRGRVDAHLTNLTDAGH